jgi:hypothetical protein
LLAKPERNKEISSSRSSSIFGYCALYLELNRRRPARDPTHILSLS